MLLHPHVHGSRERLGNRNNFEAPLAVHAREGLGVDLAASGCGYEQHILLRALISRLVTERGGFDELVGRRHGGNSERFSLMACNMCICTYVTYVRICITLKHASRALHDTCPFDCDQTVLGSNGAPAVDARRVAHLEVADGCKDEHVMITRPNSNLSLCTYIGVRSGSCR